MERLGKYILAATAVAFMFTPLLFGQAPSRAGDSANVTPPVVHSRITPDSIAIGDHFTLEVTIGKDIVQQVSFPDFKDRKMGEHIEILAESDLDTLSRDGRRVELRKSYRLTTFEEGTHAIGRFPLLWSDKNIVDTVYSADSLTLRVSTFQIDTTTQTIFDIKPQAEAPFRIGEIILYILGYLLVIRPIAIAIAAFVLLRRRRKSGSDKEGPAEPAHVTAIRSLEMLHNQKLWQNNKHKFYYTRLTDILREYIESRYGVGAMEMTSEEIMDALGDSGIPQKYYAELHDVLYEADLVKFAKHVPDAETNEKSYNDAYFFVENTKPSEVEQAPAGEKDGLKPYE